MGIVYGYARCSTDDTRQDIDRQKRDLYALGVTDEQHIFWEYASGAKKERKELLRLLNIINPGDTIITTEVSRLTRSTQHLCELLSIVQEKCLRLVIGSFEVDCRYDNIDPMTKGMLMMWGVFSEMERDIIRSRVRSGMANAKAKGKRIGRPELSMDDIPQDFYKLLSLHNDGKLTISQMAGALGVSRPTLYSWIKKAKS